MRIVDRRCLKIDRLADAVPLEADPALHSRLRPRLWRPVRLEVVEVLVAGENHHADLCADPGTPANSEPMGRDVALREIDRHTH